MGPHAIKNKLTLDDEDLLIRLAIPLAAVSAFFLLSLVTVRVFQPRDPKRFFFLYGVLLLAATAAVVVRGWPLNDVVDVLGLLGCLLLQALACLTMWNAFYSLLWGFSGSMMYDVHNIASLRDRDRLVLSYQGADPLRDRILARRLPNLAGGGWVDALGRDLAAAAERPRARDRDPGGVQVLLARHGRGRQVAVFGEVVLAAVVLVAVQTILVAGAAALRPGGNIYITILGVVLLTAPAVPFTDQIFFGRVLPVEGRVFLAARVPRAWRVSVSIHDAARSLRDAADSGRTRAARPDGRCRWPTSPSGTASGR